jgi:16S rRNA (guanine527-N7)-methyltransferase
MSTLRERLLSAGVGAVAADRALAYWELLREESSRQNLTRLLEPEAFFSGHVLDVLRLRELRKGRASSQRCLDLGSGGGVPGLLSAALFEDESWTLVDAELRKAEFLGRAVGELGLLGRVSVLHGRIEAVSGAVMAPEVASKAVGTVEKLYGWLRTSSTWNTLYLFKGPKWEEEWAAFRAGPRKGDLRVAGELRYETPEGARRVIIQLQRVPRETKISRKRD